MSFASDRHARTTNSTLWAAWADALGFITELTDMPGVRRRLGNAPLDVPVAWTRRVGGRFGVPAELPSGCYSDDTQLRLAVSRSISHLGFDAEAFAKVEMTIWPSYALGGGRASRAAAQNLTKNSASWSTNFFEGWTGAGGNGAAMRIQPHVWAARDLPSFEHLNDVIIDSIVTHGHPRAIVGAVLHAAALTFALHVGRVPDLPVLRTLLQITRDAFHAFETDDHLRDFWRPRWETVSSVDLEEAWMRTVDECDSLIGRVAPLLTKTLSSASQTVEEVTSFYEEVCDLLELRDPSRRGSGTVTVVAALVLGAASANDTRVAVLAAAAATGTDTDTIATMVGAVLGAANDISPPTAVMDEQYLIAEADRLHAVAVGEKIQSFTYPDLLRWTPPRTQLDVVGLVDGRPVVAGLGFIKLKGPSFEAKDAVWTWSETSYGQSLLVKHRLKLPSLDNEKDFISTSLSRVSTARNDSKTLQSHQMLLFEEETNNDAASSHGSSFSEQIGMPTRTSNVPAPSVDKLVHEVISSHYDEEQVGRALVALLSGSSLQDVVAFAAALWGAAPHQEESENEGPAGSI